MASACAGSRDQAHRAGGHAGLAADLLGEGHLVARPRRDHRAGHGAARTNSRSGRRPGRPARATAPRRRRRSSRRRPSRSPKCGPTAAGRVGPDRAHRGGRLRASAACGSRTRRRSGRRDGWSRATGTGAAGSRGPRGPRRPRRRPPARAAAAAAKAAITRGDVGFGHAPRASGTPRRRAGRWAPSRSAQPPASAPTGPPPLQGGAVEALRPAWASWMPGAGPCPATKAKTRAQRFDVARRPRSRDRPG